MPSSEGSVDLRLFFCKIVFEKGAQNNSTPNNNLDEIANLRPQIDHESATNPINIVFRLRQILAIRMIRVDLAESVLRRFWQATFYAGSGFK